MSLFKRFGDAEYHYVEEPEQNVRARGKKVQRFLGGIFAGCAILAVIYGIKNDASGFVSTGFIFLIYAAFFTAWPYIVGKLFGLFMGLTCVLIVFVDWSHGGAPRPQLNLLWLLASLPVWILIAFVSSQTFAGNVWEIIKQKFRRTSS